MLAALALAVMPVSVAANRSNIVDSTLVLVTLLGAWAVLRAAEMGRLRRLLLCAVLVGLGFNVKMLQAFLVVPAFGLLYLLSAPRRWMTRVGHLAVATVVLLAISLSWVTAVDLTPASQRPYVGSSSSNAHCATVPSSLWQTTSSLQSGASAGAPGFGPADGGQQLYDCASRPSKLGSARSGAGHSTASTLSRTNGTHGSAAVDWTS